MIKARTVYYILLAIVLTIIFVGGVLACVTVIKADGDIKYNENNGVEVNTHVDASKRQDTTKKK